MLKISRIQKSLMVSKKGDTASFIVGIMLTLIAFFLIGGLLLRFTSQTDDKEAELLCQNSIALRAQSAIRVGNLAGIEAKLVPPLCRTIDKKVSGEREQILRQIAEKMATCWWMFGEGRYEDILDSFGTEGLLKVLSYEDLGPNQCFNCYTILIDEEEIEGGPIEAAEISEFLLKNKYSKANLTYLDYIQGHGGPGRVVLTAPVIFPNHAYTISMMPKTEKSDFWSKEGRLGLAALLGAPATAVPAIVAFGLTEGIESAIGEERPPGELPKVTGKAVPVVGLIALGGASVYIQSTAYMSLMTEVYKERDVSSIYLGFLEVGQEMCGSGDIAGQ